MFMNERPFRSIAVLMQVDSKANRIVDCLCPYGALPSHLRRAVIDASAVRSPPQMLTALRSDARFQGEVKASVREGVRKITSMSLVVTCGSTADEGSANYLRRSAVAGIGRRFRLWRLNSHRPQILPTPVISRPDLQQIRDGLAVHLRRNIV